ncbi:hypothetical protein HZH66_010979 [Vespula vulgaris]|uniref:Uncharacterized protein n=1 Tax=Vespula vulgaris TaxID=7454 RepID=A0A834JJD5_VESVU|nr:hypothetical protein HZH66_010979 [Vespula vulgaris]
MLNRSFQTPRSEFNRFAGGVNSIVDSKHRENATRVSGSAKRRLPGERTNGWLDGWIGYAGTGGSSTILSGQEGHPGSDEGRETDGWTSLFAYN